MKRAKKDRPKAGTFEQSCPGLAPRTIDEAIIANSWRNTSPNLDRGGGALPHVLGAYAYDNRDWLACKQPVPGDRLDREMTGRRKTPQMKKQEGTQCQKA